MRRAVIVIGCSYGDEGKGLATDFMAGRLPEPCLNILINGGAQRGHTVELPDGRRHIFHHFGSAALRGSCSYADEDFILNPLLFLPEREELQADFGLTPRLAAHPRCRLSTPWDMMLGQIIEENRGAARHGSCGCGIQETRLRFLRTGWALHWGDLGTVTRDAFLTYCRRIAEEYVPARLAELHMTANAEWQAILHGDGIAEHFWEDLQAMLGCVETREWEPLAQAFPSLIFEAGQGLALDARNTADFPYLTPSRTTSLVSAQRIAALPGETDTEILYVTRSYLTRHGAGPLPGECPREEINPEIVDLTNQPNPHQQSIRYAHFDEEAVLRRTRADAEATRALLPHARTAVLVTHLNETGGALDRGPSLTEFVTNFEHAYLSDSHWNAREACVPGTPARACAAGGNMV